MRFMIVKLTKKSLAKLGFMEDIGLITSTGRMSTVVGLKEENVSRHSFNPRVAFHVDTKISPVTCVRTLS